MARQVTLRQVVNAASGSLVVILGDFGFRVGGGAIVNLHKVEAGGGGDGSALGAVAGIKRAAQVLGRPFAFSDKLQAANHRAHLIVEE